MGANTNFMWWLTAIRVFNIIFLIQVLFLVTIRVAVFGVIFCMLIMSLFDLMIDIKFVISKRRQPRLSLSYAAWMTDMIACVITIPFFIIIKTGDPVLHNDKLTVDVLMETSTLASAVFFVICGLYALSIVLPFIEVLTKLCRKSAKGADCRDKKMLDKLFAHVVDTTRRDDARESVKQRMIQRLMTRIETRVNDIGPVDNTSDFECNLNYSDHMLLAMNMNASAFVKYIEAEMNSYMNPLGCRVLVSETHAVCVSSIYFDTLTFDSQMHVVVSKIRD